MNQPNDPNDPDSSFHIVYVEPPLRLNPVLMLGLIVAGWAVAFIIFHLQ